MKPKCYGCGKKQDDPFYYWDGKNLWHWNCWYEIYKRIKEHEKQ